MKRRSKIPIERQSESLTFRLTEKAFADFSAIVDNVGAGLPVVGRRTVVFLTMIKMWSHVLDLQKKKDKWPELETEFSTMTRQQQEVIESIKSDLGLERVYRQQAEQKCEELQAIIEENGTEMLRRRWEVLGK